MGRLTELLTKGNAGAKEPVPNPFSQYQDYVRVMTDKKRYYRKVAFIRRELGEMRISMKEMIRVINAVHGEKSAQLQVYLEKSKGSEYKRLVLRAWKEGFPKDYARNQQEKKSEAEIIRIAEKNLSSAILEQCQVGAILQDMVGKHVFDKYLEKMEEGLTQSHVQELTHHMEQYKDPLDIPLEDALVHHMRKPIQKVLQNAAYDLAGNPTKLEKLSQVLTFADEHMTGATTGKREAMGEVEAAVQKVGTETAKQGLKTYAKTVQNGTFDNFFVQEADPLRGKTTHVTEGKEEAIKDLKQNGLQVSDRMKEGIRRMVAKFREMNVSKPGTLKPGEDPDKIYGFAGYVDAYREMEEALKGSDYDRMIQAGEKYRKAYEDMEELYRIAEEYFYIDQNSFPGNLDSCRNAFLPPELTHNLALTAAVNGAFLIFNQLNYTQMDVEEYLKNPLQKAYAVLENNVEKYSIDTLTQGKNFEQAVDCLMDEDDNYGLTCMNKTTSMGVGRTGEFLATCDPDADKRKEHIVKNGIYLQYSTELSYTATYQFGVLNPSKSGEAKNRTLQNLITVKHGEMPVSRLIDGVAVDQYLIKQEPLNLENYAARSTDYEGMIQRTNVLLTRAKNSSKQMEEVLEAAQEAYARVLKLRNVDRNTPAYQHLLDAFLGLEKQLPETASQELRNRMASRRDALEMTLPGTSATSKWTVDFYDRLGKDRKGLSQENRDQLEAVLKSLQELKDITEPFYEADQQGNLPKVTGEDYGKLREAFVKVARAIEDFRPEPENRVADNVAQMMQGLKQVVGQDIASLSAAKQGEEASLSDMLKQGRSWKVTVNGPLKNLGDMASTRYRINVPGPDGQQINGFFTPNSETYTRERANGLMEEAIARAVQKYGRSDLADLARNVVTRELDSIYVKGVAGAFLGNGNNLILLSRDQIRNQDKSLLLDNLWNSYSDFSPKQEELLKSAPGADFVADVIREMAPLHTVTIYRREGLEGNIDRRNCAMSTVADLLGAGHLVAGARPMTVVQDGKEMTGTFMSFAKGWDTADLSPENPLTKVTPDQMTTTESLKSMADLQVLDLICGNVDRHNRNFFYQFSQGDPPKFIGVQGIDNDFSFVRNTWMDFTISNMGIITEEMAQKVMTLTPGLLETALSPYGLGKEEIQAAWERTQMLQGQIQAGREYFKDKPAGLAKPGHLRVVKEAELAQFGPESGLYEMGIFALALGAPGANNLHAQDVKETTLDQTLVQLRNAAPEMEKALNLVTDANRGFFIGSRAYDNALKGVQQVAMARNQAISQVDPQKLDSYAAQLENAKSAIATYLVNKTRIPQNERTALENRRIIAMSRAYATLDRESQQVSAVSVISKKLTLNQDPERMARKEEIDAGRRRLQCRMEEANYQKEFSQPEDLYEGPVMKQFREQVRDQLCALMQNYDGRVPGEATKAELVSAMANYSTYTIITRQIKGLKNPEDRQKAYQQLDEHPELLTVVKHKLVQSKGFQKAMYGTLMETDKRLVTCMTQITADATLFMKDVAKEVIQSMKDFAEASRARKQVAGNLLPDQKVLLETENVLQGPAGSGLQP